METVLAAFVVIFIILFALFTAGQAIITSQETLNVTWQDVERQNAVATRTHLTFVDAYSSDGGTLLHLILENDGDIRLADFGEWDVIVHYFDAMLVNNYHINWLSYDADVLGTDKWQAEGIYQDAANHEPENFEPNVLNPGEEVALMIKLPSAAPAGTAIQALVATTNGIPAAYQFHANQPPQLTTNAGLTLATGTMATIPSDMLQTTDSDDEAGDLFYTVSIPPTQGILSLNTEFTQADIDNGLLTYTHTGTGDDTFTFTVTDGKDVVGIYNFMITENELPALTTNAGLLVASGISGIIGNIRLNVTDPDTNPAELVYTVTTAPAQGTLSLGNHFTQEDINNALLVYTHHGIGNDSFQFTVSDGDSVIGSFTFVIATF